MAGVDVRFAVEIDQHAAETYRRNHPKTMVVTQDVRRLEEIKVGPKSGTRILFGGPPCQGFSTSNQRTRTAENPHNWLFQEFVHVTRLWRPDWVVFENVKGIAETEGGMFLASVIAGLSLAGFQVSHWVLNAADFGVPQQRSRLFVVGSRHGMLVSPPEPAVNASRYVTVRDAISDLPQLSNGASDDRLPYRRGAV